MAWQSNSENIPLLLRAGFGTIENGAESSAMVQFKDVPPEINLPDPFGPNFPKSAHKIEYGGASNGSSCHVEGCEIHFKDDAP